MYVRLAFAVAAHLESEILIVDEVLAVGDAEFRNKCLGKMQDISGNQGRTVLFVSHDMAAISSLCSKGIVLKNGCIIQSGDVGESIEYYVSDTKNAVEGALDFSKREGDGTLIIKNIHFDSGSVLKSGDAMKFTMEFDKAISYDELQKIYLLIEFTNNLKRKIFTLSNKYCQIENWGNELITKISFEVDSLQLAEGLYGIDYWMSNGGSFADGVKDVAKIEVVGSDYFGTGYMPVPRKHGEFLVKHKAVVLQ
jgi:lipopolysaccharide transport system ATP-binding protein